MLKRYSILVGLAAAAIIFTGCGESVIDSVVGDDDSQEIVPTTSVLYADWGEPASGVTYQCGSDIVKVTGSDGMMYRNMAEPCTLYGLDDTVSLTTDMNVIYTLIGFSYSCESGLSRTEVDTEFTFDPFWIPADPTLAAGDVCVIQFDEVI